MFGKKLQLFRVRFGNLIRNRANYHQPDYVVITIVAVIVVFGLVMLSSVSSAVSYARFQSTYVYFNRQLFGLVMGFALFYITSRLDYHRYKDLALPLLALSLGLLVIVFIPGLAGGWGNARSWVNIFGFSLQPSELVKITFLLYLAAWIDTRNKDLRDLHQGTAPFLILLGVITVLMLAQPDTGTLFIILAISLSVYFIGGGNTKHITYIVIAGFIGLLLMLKIAPYQLDRFRCFFDHSYSPQDVCYQLNQSLIAVGSGGFWGKGFGNSRQKFSYLPEVQGDAIFPVIAEEMGMAVSVVLVGLFAYLFYRGYLISKRAPDRYGKLLAIGIVTWFVFQAFVNIGGIINLIPLTGVPLPFISYGGSAMMAALAAAGILVNISKQTK
jgi:cell division protein FtsW